jgi:hAT family C-terminal dimerisation region
MKRQHVLCFPHAVNRTVQSFIESLYNDELGDDVSDIITRIRHFAKGIRKSNLRWQEFQKVCADAKISACTIPLDVDIRWNSLFRMLETAIYLRKPIRRFLDDCSETDYDFHERTVLADSEWEIAELLLVILFPFKLATARFENNSRTPEIPYLFLAFDRLFSHIDDINDSLDPDEGGQLSHLRVAPILRQAIQAMYSKLSIYYSKTNFPYVYADAMILDPRCKLALFGERSWSDFDTEVYVEDFRQRFELNYLGRSKATSTAVVQTNKRTIHDVEGDAPNDDEAEFRQMLSSRPSDRDTTKNAFDRYMGISNDANIGSCLEYWKSNEKSLADMALMARDSLAVAASGCSVERLFSVSGRVSTWQRARLNDTTIRDLMIYKSVNHINDNIVKQEIAGEENEELEVEESAAIVPGEWGKDWWKKKMLDKKNRVRPADLISKLTSH